MIFLPKAYTLHVQTRDDETGIWLCLDNGFETIPVARFVSEEAAEQYKHAICIATMKAHANGRFGI
jgi:hypothetical protein